MEMYIIVAVIGGILAYLAMLKVPFMVDLAIALLLTFAWFAYGSSSGNHFTAFVGIMLSVVAPAVIASITEAYRNRKQGPSNTSASPLETSTL